MYDNLKERLTDMSVLASTRTPADALQYIEELEAEIADLKAKLATCKKYRDAYAECDRIATQAVRDLDAKLAKAVEIGDKMAASIEGNYYLPGVATNWRKLTGGKDE